jgi:predicted  nucleic acid-binding Zn-ribbon protein
MVHLLSSKSKENEVSVDSFIKLKEIDSLSKMRIKYLSEIKEQDDRLSKLYEKRQSAIMQTAGLKEDLIAREMELVEVEKNLKRASTQKQNLIDLGGDETKIKNFQTEVDEWEEKGFGIFEEVEAHQNDLKDSQTFTSGIEKTIADIEAEVNLLKEKSKKEIENLELRIDLLKADLPEDFLTILNRTFAKNLSQGSFTRIEQGSCFFCRAKMSRIEESEIDMQKGLKVCHQCSRIFLPYGA